MRIAIVSDVYWPRVNGLVISIDAFKAELESMGHTIGVFTNRYSRNDARQDSEEGRRNIHRYTSLPSPIYSPEEHQVAPHAWPDLFNGLKHFKPDIVHIQTEFFNAAMSIHTHYEFYINNYVPIMPKSVGRIFVRWYMWQFFRKAEELIIPSEHFRATMIRYGLRNRRMHVIPTGLNLDRFRIDPEEQQRFLKEFHSHHPVVAGSRLLLFVGRIGQEKNLDLLLDVMELVLRRQPDTVLLVVGDGPYRRAFHHLAFKRNLHHKILFTGYVDHWKLKYIYAEADVFVFPSISETQGLVTVEAMACGTPVVAVGEMGTYFVMRGDNGGFMVPNQADVFAARVLELLENPALRAAKSADALVFARRWSIDSMAKSLVAVYERLLARPRNRK
jgi:1,2-diacylglycerol 3-alpha-glucosyltransferase